MVNKADISAEDILVFTFLPHPGHPYAYYGGGATISVTSTDVSVALSRL